MISPGMLAGRKSSAPATTARSAPAAVGGGAGDRAADQAGDGKGAADDPDLEIGAVQLLAHESRQHRQRRPDREQPEVGDDEQAGERGPAAEQPFQHSPDAGFLAHPALNSARLIFPLGVFGSSSANSTIRGYL